MVFSIQHHVETALGDKGLQYISIGMFLKAISYYFVPYIAYRWVRNYAAILKRYLNFYNEACRVDF